MAKAKVKRIFISGTAGSLWSGVDRYLRYALLGYVDNSDITDYRNHEGHQGAYWNPGNEPSWDWILNFGDYDRDHIIETLDSAYSDPIPDASEKEFIVRTHKSHFWAYHYDKLVELFPNDDILICRTPQHKAWIWWQICGGHDTVFNDYKYYNRDYGAIWEDIGLQLSHTDRFIEKYQLEKEMWDRSFIEKYFTKTPHPLFDRRIEDSIRHPEKMNSLAGGIWTGTHITDKTRLAIKLGNYRPFEK
jgi:hypothetical protein